MSVWDDGNRLTQCRRGRLSHRKPQDQSRIKRQEPRPPNQIRNAIRDCVLSSGEPRFIQQDTRQLQLCQTSVCTSETEQDNRIPSCPDRFLRSARRLANNLSFPRIHQDCQNIDSRIRIPKIVPGFRSASAKLMRICQRRFNCGRLTIRKRLHPSSAKTAEFGVVG